MRSGPRGDGLVWTHDTILYALHLWVRRHGRPPAAREWDRAGEDHPSRQTVQRVFGRWNRAYQSPRPTFLLSSAPLRESSLNCTQWQPR